MKRKATGKSKKPTEKKKKKQYKVRNWHEYNQALVNRYNITLWIEKGIADVWREGDKIIIKRKKGAQLFYSKQAIDCLATLKELFHLTYRGIEGFGQSVFNGMLRLALPIPNYSTIDRRRKGLNVSLPTKSSGKIHVVFDSSGLKVYGEGEWKVRMHGWSKRRTWKKIHLTINPVNNDIEAMELTDNSVDDAQMVKPMLAQIEKEIMTSAGDGAYDKDKVYAALTKRAQTIAIPPSKNAKIWYHGNRKGTKHPRDENLRRIRVVGRRRWKEEINYHQRSLAETGMYRYKIIFGDKLTSRDTKQQEIEAQIKCKILNKMAHLGMPQSYAVP